MTQNEDARSEITAGSNRDGNEKTIKEQRIAVVDEVESLLEDLEEQTGHRIGRVRQNINLARSDPLDDGEFNYCVRLALLQLQQDAEKVETGATELCEVIDAVKEQLPEAAALPPQEQLTR